MVIWVARVGLWLFLLCGAVQLASLEDELSSVSILHVSGNQVQGVSLEAGGRRCNVPWMVRAS